MINKKSVEICFLLNFGGCVTQLVSVNITTQFLKDIHVFFKQFNNFIFVVY